MTSSLTFRDWLQPRDPCEEPVGREECDVKSVKAHVAEEVIAFWVRKLAIFSLGSNGRLRDRAAVNLGWLPRSITRWIASDFI
jgi:hypothetical protein